MGTLSLAPTGVRVIVLLTTFLHVIALDRACSYLMEEAAATNRTLRTPANVQQMTAR
ncbi:hypothetical protein HDU93_004207, partial [Gonapodya sp. JEL0774]